MYIYIILYTGFFKFNSIKACLLHNFDVHVDSVQAVNVVEKYAVCCSTNPARTTSRASNIAILITRVYPQFLAYCTVVAIWFVLKSWFCKSQSIADLAEICAPTSSVRTNWLATNHTRGALENGTNIQKLIPDVCT